MTRAFNLIFTIMLSLLLIQSSAQETNKRIIDLTVFDTISQTLLRTELKITELFDVIKKVAVIHHEREFHPKNEASFVHLPSDGATDLKIVKYDPLKIRKHKRPVDNEPPNDNPPARKSYRSKYNHDDDDDDDDDDDGEDGDSNANVNTNINTNTNIRKRPSYANFLK